MEEQKRENVAACKAVVREWPTPEFEKWRTPFTELVRRYEPSLSSSSSSTLPDVVVADASELEAFRERYLRFLECLRYLYYVTKFYSETETSEYAIRFALSAISGTILTASTSRETKKSNVRTVHDRSSQISSSTTKRLVTLDRLHTILSDLIDTFGMAFPIPTRVARIGGCGGGGTMQENEGDECDATMSREDGEKPPNETMMMGGIQAELMMDVHDEEAAGYAETFGNLHPEFQRAFPDDLTALKIACGTLRVLPAEFHGLPINSYRVHLVILKHVERCLQNEPLLKKIVVFSGPYLSKTVGVFLPPPPPSTTTTTTTTRHLAPSTVPSLPSRSSSFTFSSSLRPPPPPHRDDDELSNSPTLPSLFDLDRLHEFDIEAALGRGGGGGGGGGGGDDDEEAGDSQTHSLQSLPQS